MAKVRLTLLGAIAVAVLLALGLLAAPISGWLSVVAKIGAGISAFSALGSVTLFLFTLFPAKEDLWETGYFKYMRCVWGDTWGGHSEPFQISTCRASQLSAWVALMWLIFLFMLVAVWYLNINVAASKLGHLGLLTSTGMADSVAGAAVFFNIMGIILIAILSVLLSYRESIINKTIPRFFYFMAGVLASTLGLSLTFSLFVIPIMNFGWFPYLKFVGGSLGALAALTAAIFLLYGAVLLGTKVSKKISQRTVPGQLVASHGLKSKICPMIVQKTKTQNPIL